MKKLWIPIILSLGCFAVLATAFGEVEQICVACGGKDKYRVLMSSNAMGARDLDARPAEMLRSTISLWVEKCSSYGYCAKDITKCLKYAEDTESCQRKTYISKE